MSLAHPLQQVVSELDQAGAEHMLAGSFASTFHGDPRTTNDIDLVIDCDRDARDRLVQQLDPGRFYVSAHAVDEAWQRRGELDLEYIERWVRELNLAAAWELARSRAGI